MSIHRLQALQGPIALAGPAKAIAFLSECAFTYIAEAPPKRGPNLDRYSPIATIQPFRRSSLPPALRCPLLPF